MPAKPLTSPKLPERSLFPTELVSLRLRTLSRSVRKTRECRCVQMKARRKHIIPVRRSRLSAACSRGGASSTFPAFPHLSSGFAPQCRAALPRRDKPRRSGCTNNSDRPRPSGLRGEKRCSGEKLQPDREAEVDSGIAANRLTA